MVCVTAFRSNTLNKSVKIKTENWKNNFFKKVNIASFIKNTLCSEDSKTKQNRLHEFK